MRRSTGIVIAADRPKSMDVPITTGASQRRRILAHLLLGVTALLAGGALLTTVAPRTYAADDPAVAIGASTTSGQAPFEVHFTGSSSDMPSAWTWDFGDGTTGSTPDPNHWYTSAGTFSVRLTVSYADHPDVVVTKTDLVLAAAPPPPPAPLVPPGAAIRVSGLAIVVGRPVVFADTSTGGPTSWAWRFGDGTSSNLAQPTHTYAVAGMYTVTLLARGNGGADMAIKQVTVLDSWTGGAQLYEDGIFSKQATLRWCVPASTQMMRNLVAGEQDHSAATQRAYFNYGRAHNGYRTPASDGIDPAGWQAMLRRYVDPGYRIVSAGSYTAAVRAAARAIRITGRPVGVFVGYGHHVWVMSGFTATADPAVTDAFTVTSVNVEGPLWNRASVNGFDPVPNVRLSIARFRYFLTPYRDRYEPHGWRNRYVIVVP